MAKAAFYPSITLTASGGYQTSDLLGIISRSGFAYGLGGIVDIPIFSAGRRKGNYKSAKAQYQAMLIGYQKAINGAFRDVSDTLVGYQKTKEYAGSVTLLAANAAKPEHARERALCRRRYQLSGSSRHGTSAAERRARTCAGAAGCSDVSCAALQSTRRRLAAVRDSMTRPALSGCRFLLAILLLLMVLFPVLEDMTRPIFLTAVIASVFVVGVAVVHPGRSRVRNAIALAVIQIGLNGLGGFADRELVCVSMCSRARTWRPFQH